MPVTLRVTVLCIPLAVLGGCASVTPINDIAHSRLHPPVRILLAETAPSLSAARLQKVFAPENKKKLTLSDKPLVQAVAHSQQSALANMRAVLHRYPDIKLIPPTPDSTTELAVLVDPKTSAKDKQSAADRLRQRSGADAVLRFGITDYGLTPKTWRTGYITFEVVTTLGITVAIASLGGSVAKGAAGAYLAQEIVEETIEGYAGFWALDKVCRPVRIEAELIQLDPPAVVWRYSDTGLADVHFSRLYRKIDAAERWQQLDQSTSYAIQDLVNILNHNLHGTRIARSPATLKWELN